MIAKKPALAAFLTLLSSFLLFSQTAFDVENINVDDLSDKQITQLLAKARSMGYSEGDIYTLAQSQNVPANQIAKLQARIAALKTPQTETPTNTQAPPQVSSPIPKPPTTKPRKYFGYDLFAIGEERLSFETDLALPAPDEYVIGTGDEITVIIYGASEKVYKEQVSETGTLYLPNIGPIFISGLTVNEAAKRVTGRLSTVYTDLRSNAPDTFVQFTLSKVRNIKISIVGEVVRPGSYTVNGLSTVFNAMYLCGGPTPNGTLRGIKVFRNSKLVSQVDYYQFLTEGITGDNITLRSGDVILVSTRLERVEISGQVKRPAFYEMKSGETFEDLLLYAGGFTEDAYTSKVKVTRNTDVERVVADIRADQFSIFEIKAGDRYVVDKILERFSNRVTVKGAVFRPGNFALHEGMRVSQLIEKADGITGDAFLQRAILIRTKKDLSTETIDIDLNNLMANGTGDVLLAREDVLEILSVYDLEEELYVKISGEVNRGGVFPFSQNMTLQDLIFTADGFTQAAEQGVIEISRKPDAQSPDKTFEILKISLDNGLQILNDEVKLQPYDHVFVRRNPNYFKEKTVEVTGEIRYPGTYTLLSEEERISDILERSGGLKNIAYVQGATLTRNTEFFVSETEIETRKADLAGILSALDTAYLSEADERKINEIYRELNNTYLFPKTNDANLASQAKRERLMELVKSNPFLEGVEIKQKESIAIDMEEILARPGSPADLILEDGDIIHIPKELKTIRMRGRVLYPNTVRFEKGKKLNYYINKAGGFGNRARRDKTYVVYANGEVSRTHSFLFFRVFPEAAPGSEVIVPVRPLRIPLKPADIIGLTSGLATLALIVSQTINVSRNP